MILDPRAPKVESLTQFSDQILINVNAKASGNAEFTLSAQRLLPGPKSPIPVPLGDHEQMFILLQGFTIAASKVLGAEHRFIQNLDLMRGQLVADLKALETSEAS